MNLYKLSFSGVIKSIQPRICLSRSFDESSHKYLGFNILLDGSVNSVKDTFWIAVGKGAQRKFQFRTGDEIKGKCMQVFSDLEIADYYKISELKLLKRKLLFPYLSDSPPFIGPAPALEDYREVGCRRLNKRTYEKKCMPCIFACNMPTRIIKDNFKPLETTFYRTETFCYGPISCSLYNAGKPRRVLGRHSDYIAEV